jgi:hypothetical protein
MVNAAPPSNTMPTHISPCLLAIAVPALLSASSPRIQDPGYTDTPRLANGWRVHDAARPRPPAVDPGPAPALAAAAPADALRLFAGSDLDAFRGRGSAAAWVVRDGFAEVNGTGDIETKAEFGDCQLHVEWAAPAVAKGASQGRGNSGVFFLGRYEVQILDSFENPTYADGQAAALYGQTPPLVNASRRPGEWQSFDIVFRAPHFRPDGSLASPARATVFHNGVLVHLDQEFFGETSHRTLPAYRQHGDKGPIRLQDHGDPVRFRNIWVRPVAFDAPGPK